MEDYCEVSINLPPSPNGFTFPSWSGIFALLRRCCLCSHQPETGRVMVPAPSFIPRCTGENMKTTFTFFSQIGKKQLTDCKSQMELACPKWNLQVQNGTCKSWIELASSTWNLQVLNRTCKFQMEIASPEFNLEVLNGMEMELASPEWNLQVPYGYGKFVKGEN